MCSAPESGVFGSLCLSIEPSTLFWLVMQKACNHSTNTGDRWAPLKLNVQPFVLSSTKHQRSYLSPIRNSHENCRLQLCLVKSVYIEWWPASIMGLLKNKQWSQMVYKKCTMNLLSQLYHSARASCPISCKTWGLKVSKGFVPRRWMYTSAHAVIQLIHVMITRTTEEEYPFTLATVLVLEWLCFVAKVIVWNNRSVPFSSYPGSICPCCWHSTVLYNYKLLSAEIGHILCRIAKRNLDFRFGYKLYGLDFSSFIQTSILSVHNSWGASTPKAATSSTSTCSIHSCTGY